MKKIILLILFGFFSLINTKAQCDGKTINFGYSNSGFPVFSGTFSYIGMKNGKCEFKHTNQYNEILRIFWNNGAWVFQTDYGSNLYYTTTDVGSLPPNFQTGNWQHSIGHLVPNQVDGSGTVKAFVNNPTLTNATNCALNNGSANITTNSFGIAPYTYSWKNALGNVISTTSSASNLTTGSYTVIVTDGSGEINEKSFTIGESLVTPTISSQTNVSCNGGTNGSATITATGGTAPYTYSWSPSGGTAATATGLAAGTYTCTITDANACSKTVSTTITQPTTLMLTNAAQTNVSCNGGFNGSASVNAATGGTGPYSYNWTPGNPTGDGTLSVSGLDARTWTCTVTDANGCTKTVTTTITQPTTALNGSIAKTDVSCNGGTNGSATITATGGTAPYTYSWSPSGGTAATATGLAAGTYTCTITDANACSKTVSTTITQPTTLMLTNAAQTNVSCNGGFNGSASVNAATGGTGPYSYNWTPGNPTGDGTLSVSGLDARTWTCTVTDANGCTKTVTTTITQPTTALNGSIAKTDVSCNGGTNGSATITATGGTAPYTYSWSPSGGTAATTTGLAAGTYTCTITDANGCTKTVTTTILQPTTALNGSIAKTDVSCNGGTNGKATVTATGGTAPYTYSWSPSGGTAATATGLAAGTYTCTITDANGCTKTVTTTITQPTTALNGSIAKTDVSCNGDINGKATVTATGGTVPYTYSWSPSGGTAATATGLAAGTYTCTITDANGCTKTVTTTITQPTTALNGSIAKTDVSCNGGTNGSATITATGGTVPYTYSWSPSGGTAATATGLAAGNYTCTITDANGCTKTVTTTITQPTTALNGSIAKTDVSCNGGTNGKATVTATGGTAPYTYSWSPSGGTVATATGLAAGTYTFTITDANGCTKTVTTTITQPTTALNGSIAKTDVSCNGGTNGKATVTATGGTVPYTYSWSPSGGTAATATGLAAGTYTCTITDANGCTKTVATTITQPTTALNGSIAKTDVSCNGGTNGKATVTATGGTVPYTYSWSPSGGTAATATGLAAGTYTCTITDANGCTKTVTTTITQPAALIAEATQNYPATCLQNSNASATVAISGGTAPYSYAWDNGVNTATANNLSVGNHTVMITDANGCKTTATIATTFADTVAPVPSIVNLPTITKECAVLSTDIIAPTATDNCAGILTATTTSALSYTNEGTYTITWTYNDGNGNTTTQLQTVVVQPSPLANTTLNSLTTVYNGSAQTLNVTNLPANASVSYSINPDTGLNNGAINAGTYVITAVVTPPITSVNCEKKTLTANLVIEKATQTIAFNELDALILENAADFQLAATATSDLPINYSYTYNQSSAAATVTSQGWVELQHSGSIFITAHQDGNNNYLPATVVERELIINSKDATIHQLVINEKVYNEPNEDIYYMQNCDALSNEVAIDVNTEFGATVIPANKFTIITPKPGIFRKTITITSENGEVTKTYNIVIERPFNFDDIVIQKFDNTLLVNNNPETNGGYRFVKYQWYKNDVLVGENQVYSVGNSTQDILDETALYSVTVTTENGDVIHTCASEVTRKHNFKINVYPNPVNTNEELQVVFDYPSSSFNGATAELFTTTGKRIHSAVLKEKVSSVQLPAEISSGIYILVLNIEGKQEVIKVIVK
ncbi:T9SS type A sorting domain-containing protein [Myroides sp. JBRI-B21084]|uniref:T9SS type A sorting domain-containing protein n=1 Tax=Myroides sp. JBRI-B21084 TaxID=3119977 RepID=UPI0026E213CB|nr:T9SS type A sorting domain-containing protein [Paenimyroides cloacae]WKW47122.1 T9SS type A sorting domain-containing protein [Paenimyroides cloacae]